MAVTGKSRNDAEYLKVRFLINNGGICNFYQIIFPKNI